MDDRLDMIEQTREQRIRKITWVGLIVNIILSIVKFAAGILGSSQALVADAVHSLSDTTTDAAVIAGSHYWSKPPDDDHPYGHRRIETLVTLFIGFILLSAGLGIGIDVYNHFEAEHKPPTIVALLAAVFSVITKETLYRWTVHSGKRMKSAALTANAWHHRIDALSSVPVVLAVGGVILMPQLKLLDPIGAAIVSVFIIHAALKIIWPGLKELIDSGASKEECEKILSSAMEVESVHAVHGIRTRYVSSSLQVDMKIVVDGFITVHKGHEIAKMVKNKIMKEFPDVIDVIIHVDPVGHDEQMNENICV